MGDEEVEREIEDIGVIARVAPEDKVHLVDILKRKGDVVAMTGDGVNDAPALKRADIGVAMGITGTEVSKEAAVMILTDDNFATIVKAVELGRALYDNLLRYIRYQMAGLFGFIVTFLGASLFYIAGGIPFTPIQTLWVNFTVTVFLAIGLGYGQARAGLMDDPPRPPERPILPTRLFAYLVVIGVVMAACTLGVIWWGTDSYGEAVGRTMGLTTFSLVNIWFAIETSDPRHSIVSIDLMGNRSLLKGVGLAALVTVAAAELGLLNRLLGTTRLDLEQWIVCFVVSLAVLALVEVAKLLGVSARAVEGDGAVDPGAASAAVT
jgi:Ca2+-transporting ATPase